MFTIFGREGGESVVREESYPAPARALAENPNAEEVRWEMACAMVGALNARDHDYRLSEHCARVAASAAEMADECGVAERDAYLLVSAATLHEVGKVALSALLLDGSRPDVHDTFGKLRAHARIGGEIVRATRGPLAGWLVEEQYSDYEWLRRILRKEDPELLLAGILRVADVADAVAHARRGPAHAPLEEVLLRGRGSRFHPDAVDVYLKLAERRPSHDGQG